MSSCEVSYYQGRLSSKRVIICRPGHYLPIGTEGGGGGGGFRKLSIGRSRARPGAAVQVAA